MAIAHDRAEVMAANDVMSHTEPDGRKVFDRLNDAHITWFAGGEILAWNNYPTEYTVGRGHPRLDGVARPPRDHGLDRLQLRRLRGGGVGDGPALLRRRCSSASRTRPGAWPDSGRSRSDRSTTRTRA